MRQFGDCYRQRKVLLTGHTGFKGSWLALWLKELGAEVTGLALPPDTSPNHWSLLGLDMKDHHDDIRDFRAVSRVFAESRPEIVFHLAAQPLVRRSYRDPLESWSTNVMGTANVLEASRLSSSVRAIVVVTTDKVYVNKEWPWGYRENDRLGGHDPYSASKAGSELVAESYRKAYFDSEQGPLLASARAGNVIGGGDWAPDRLIPDLVRAVGDGLSAEIRFPNATRPWQHVLECLSGYLRLGQGLLEGRRECADAWNFGPDPADNRSVVEVLASLKSHWPDLNWHVSQEKQSHEAKLLYLDSAKARSKLGWNPVWNLEQGLAATARWYQSHQRDDRIESHAHLGEYLAAARSMACSWLNS